MSEYNEYCTICDKLIEEIEYCDYCGYNVCREHFNYEYNVCKACVEEIKEIFADEDL